MHSNVPGYRKFRSHAIAYRVSIVTHNEVRTSAPKSFDEVWVQDNTASPSWPGLSNETKLLQPSISLVLRILVDSIFQKSAI